MIFGAACRNKWGLIDHLIIPSLANWRLAGKYDHWNMRPHGNRQNRHNLRQPGSTSDTRTADLAKCAGIGSGRGNGGMLMPGINKFDTTLMHGPGPMHVGIAKQGKTSVNSMLAKNVSN